MKWFYAEAGRQMGPIEESALDDLVRAGVVRDETLVWSEGMASWLPHGSVRGARPYMPSMPEVPSAAPAATAAPSASATAGAGAMPGPSANFAPTYCVECGRPFAPSEMVMIGGAPVCAMCKPIHLQRLRESGQVAGQRRYAGFWIRFAARVVDGVLLGVVGVIIRLPLTLVFGFGRLRGPASVAVLPVVVGLIGVLTLINIAIAVAYEVYFVSTKGGTPGKMVFGLKIIRADGGPVPPMLALGRYFAMWISGIILMIGYIMAGFDPEKRALHDRICETRVIYAR